MGYLSDYILYNSGAETPDEYLYWSGLSLLGHVLGNKVWIIHGDHFKFMPNLYIALVGTAGSGKNTGLGPNIDIMIEEYPEMLVSASIQSREDIAFQMSDDHIGLKIWKDSAGILRHYRPFYMLNNELASILSVDKMKMIEFLTEVYDGRRFSTGFKKDRQADPTRKQWFDNPHFSLLAGAVPEWFMASLRMDLFSGGLGRRLIIVNSQRTKIVPDPRRPEGAYEAWKRVKLHLRRCYEFHGEISRDLSAMKWWDTWYRKQKENKPTDPILAQFHETEPMQVLKLAMLLHCTEWPIEPKMGPEPLIASAEMLDNLKPSIVRLTSGIGRNELAGVGAQMMDFIERMGGMVSEISLRKQFYRYLRMPEFLDIEQHYINIGELVVTINPADAKKYYFSKGGYTQYEIKKKQEKEPPTTG
jgi:hypothetical protein